MLDACAVVNLFATRFMSEILAEVEGPVAIVDVVAGEAQFVFRGGDGDDAREREPVDLNLVVSQGRLRVITTEDEAELLTFIDLTLEVGDGEAMTAALAIHRGWTVVTDDRKATRVMIERGVRVRSSLDLVRAWSDQSNLDVERLRTALIDLRVRGRYEPARQHPLRTWWDQALDPR